MSRYSTLAIGVSIALAACGGAGGHSEHGEGPGIDEIRAYAAAHPNDPAAQRQLAEWEILGPGGEPSRAGAAVARARELAPTDVAVLFLAGLLAEQHGQPGPALDAFLAVIAAAPSSPDPLTPYYVESSIAYLRDLETNAPGQRTRTLAALEPFLRAPGSAGPIGRRAAWLWLRENAILSADVDRERRLDADRGCPTEARAAGPFGPYVLTPFDETLPAEGRGPLAASYDLGPGRGAVPTAELTAERCELTVGEGPHRGAGTHVVEATLHVATGGRHVLLLQTAASVQITIDGTLVDRIDRRRSQRGSLTLHPVELTAGDHELELKLATRESSFGLSWTLDAPASGYRPTEHLAIPERIESLAGRFAVIDVLSVRGDAVTARERLLGTLRPDSPSAMLTLAARVVAADPYAPSQRRQDEQRALHRLAHERDPDAQGPALRAALDEEDPIARQNALRAVAERWNDLASVQLTVANELREAGLEYDADQLLDRAAELRPDACAVLGARRTALTARRRYEDADALIAPLGACNARGELALGRALEMHDWDAARSQLERMAPLLTEEDARGSRLVLARASGDERTETELLDEITEEGDPGEHVIFEADRHYQRGERAAALRELETEAAREPRHSGDLRRLTYALSGTDVMEPYRVDGLDVIRRFEASGRRYEGQSAVLMFDYMVTRVFEDGTSIDLVHQIYRVQSAEGIERFSEMNLSGRVLTVRAIASDGTVREPDRSTGHITMPPLSEGDYVEYELVRQEGPSWGDGYASNGWVFQNYSQPFDHSEMVFVAPVSLDLRYDLRGPVPPPESRVEDGLRIDRFLMTELAALVPEPNTVDEPPFIPSLRAGVRVTWERMYRSVLDVLVDRDPLDPAAQRLLVDEILAGAGRTERERAARIHRWVMENVDEVEDSFYSVAPVMLAERRGHRLRVLRYLLELAEIDAKIAFAREITGRAPNDEVPDTRVYDSMLVVARVDGAPLYMVAVDRGMPHDAFLPSLRGQDAVVLTEGLPHITLPTSQGRPPGREVSADIVVDRSGQARAHVVMTLTSMAGGELREAIRNLPPAERATVLAERYAPAVLPGAVADPGSIRVHNLDDWEQDLSIEMDAVSSVIVQRARDAAYVVPLFETGVEGSFARLPTRTTTEAVGEMNQHVTLRIRGPGAMRAPEPLRLEGPGGASASLEVSREDDGAIRLERTIRMPYATVTAEAYPRFAQFCRAVTEMEERTVFLGP
ncbi:MAG: hypothetical protein AB7S26_04085 [Sandaracinaceae bacterium]